MALPDFSAPAPGLRVALQPDGPLPDLDAMTLWEERRFLAMVIIVAPFGLAAYYARRLWRTFCTR